MKNILSVKEAYQLSKNDDVIILDASQDGNKVGMTPNNPGKYIIGARVFDIKNEFSDTTSPLPNMFCNEEQFNHNAQKLGIKKKHKILIYDNLGIFTAPRAWWMFKTMGHTDVAVINGGIDEWIKEGLPTSSTPFTDFEKGDFKGIKQYQNIISSSQIEESLSQNQYQVIDARGKGRFDGTVKEPREGMRSGHIPGAYNLPFKDLLENGNYKSLESRKEIINNLELPDNIPLVFSCGSGITACVDLLGAADILNNEMKVYDGSWTEWGASDYPIE
ncbi:sulfurtransferase [Flammeovirga sp. MY04]|uniref:sulfurtransferase n=1 Tax=Flammeovirga sp. MY04 TaxID=1191459 RepID=UPI0008062901|nr:sulfurtransferase [Flammeovirga sp. MY04]ANQ52074.1 sulfurtransferase [Flammeovirga sp. MY04]